MNDVSSYLDDTIFAQLRGDFLSEARERLNTMEAAAAEAEETGGEALVVIRREGHNLKGMAGSVGFPSITMIAHRLEDFVAELATLTGGHINDVLAYVDCLRDIVEAGKDPGDARTGELLRGLPAHITAEFEVAKSRPLEVMLVTPARALGHMLTGELRSLGCRVSTIRSPWQAIEMAVRLSPDLTITSAVMDQITGIDLVRALRAMALTENLPLALLTSFPSDHPEMQRLPENVPVIHLGKTLSDDLGDVVTHLALA